MVAVIDFTVWFAITFYVYLETQSVFATGMLAGLYLLMTAASGIWFGSLVDRYPKKTMMWVATAVSAACYAVGLVIDRTAPPGAFTQVSSVRLWLFVVVLMLGVIVGNIRTIAMPTIVTMVVEPDRRDRANGLVGSASGVSFLVTSVIGGLLVAAGGMLYVLILGIAVNLLAIVHLHSVRLIEPTTQAKADTHRIDLRGTFRLVKSTPGLLALIVFSAINNLLGGVFMALMDAYGLSLMSVQAWGLLWGVLSTGFIIGGLLVARFGVGRKPVRAILVGNLILWIITIGFPLATSVLLLAIGMFAFMGLSPWIEAAEQTVLQRVVPFDRQGRVFGFAQSVEQAASPMTAFVIGPITQFAVIPFMTTGWGAEHLGPWFGTGPDRGIALVFVVTAFLGLIITVLALRSRYYRQLSAEYLRAAPPATVVTES